MLSKFLSQWKHVVSLMNSKGIPIPTVRDPKTGQGSISLTLVFVSSIMVIVGLAGKWSKYLGDIDVSNALQFFYGSAALYFGRNLKTKDGATIAGDAPTDLASRRDPPPSSGPGPSS